MMVLRQGKDDIALADFNTSETKGSMQVGEVRRAPYSALLQVFRQTNICRSLLMRPLDCVR